MVITGKDIRETWQSLPRGSGAVAMEAGRIEGEVMALARMAAVCTRSADGGDVAGVWQEMMAVCDSGLSLLRELRSKDASVTLDGLLDLRRHCEALEVLHGD